MLLVSLMYLLSIKPAGACVSAIAGITCYCCLPGIPATAVFFANTGVPSMVGVCSVVFVLFCCWHTFCCRRPLCCWRPSACFHIYAHVTSDAIIFLLFLSSPLLLVLLLAIPCYCCVLRPLLMLAFLLLLVSLPLLSSQLFWRPCCCWHPFNVVSVHTVCVYLMLPVTLLLLASRLILMPRELKIQAYYCT
jgi:hypothetical protein